MQYRGLLRCMRLSPQQSSPRCFSTFPHVRLRARSSEAQHSPRDMESANSACDRSLLYICSFCPRSLGRRRSFWEPPRCCTTTFWPRYNGNARAAKFLLASVFGCVSWPYTSPLKLPNGSSWQKGRPGAGENYIWPVPEGTDQVSNKCANGHSNVTKCWQVTARFMQAMHDAHVALGMWSHVYVPCSSSDSRRPVNVSVARKWRGLRLRTRHVT